MQSVISTETFERQAREIGLTEAERTEIVLAIAANPGGGVAIRGSGGAQKMRHAGRGRGKSGSFRTIHYFAGTDVPIFLLAVYAKGRKDTLSASEIGALSALLPRIAAAYRNRR